ncbi:hypothetical protein FRX31_033830 [Thalictrum thalictroides]|uniref:Uncharacterized protein n=1 Tax=Thalictrum thalictroides TaxID=46969 RepID=A0A7J6UVE8_THATH|nr:hypothetical protein FRX31_033830 [Thalictrum thalictroides]
MLERGDYRYTYSDLETHLHQKQGMKVGSRKWLSSKIRAPASQGTTQLIYKTSQACEVSPNEESGSVDRCNAIGDLRHRSSKSQKEKQQSSVTFHQYWLGVDCKEIDPGKRALDSLAKTSSDLAIKLLLYLLLIISDL